MRGRSWVPSRTDRCCRQRRDHSAVGHISATQTRAFYNNNIIINISIIINNVPISLMQNNSSDVLTAVQINMFYPPVEKFVRDECRARVCWRTVPDNGTRQPQSYLCHAVL